MSVTTTEEVTTEQKIRTLMNDALGVIDSNTLHEMLCHGDSHSGIEPLEGEAYDAVRDWLTDDWGDEKTVDEWADHPEILNRLEQLALATSEREIKDKLERGGVNTYLTAVRREALRVPKWFAPRIVQHEISKAENSTFSGPRDWQKLIGLLQIQQESDFLLGDTSQGENREERRHAWDELLKFTKYRVKVTYSVDDGLTSFNHEGWAQDGATVQNQAIRQIPDEGDFEDAEPTVIRRFQPGMVNDPLPDLEKFVFYGVTA